METGAISHAEIDVTVTDARDAPLPGVTGTLQGGLIGERVEVANARGRMVFSDLSPGTYELTFTLAGFATASREITIHETNEHDPMQVVMQLAHP